jgi:hypothetical protein
MSRCSSAPATATLREVAGIFQYLASGQARSDVRVEFQPAVFNAMMNLVLGQAHAIITNKGDGDNLSPGGIRRVCFTIFAAYSSALSRSRRRPRRNSSHKVVPFDGLREQCGIGFVLQNDGRIEGLWSFYKPPL